VAAAAVAWQQRCAARTVAAVPPRAPSALRLCDALPQPLHTLLTAHLSLPHPSPPLTTSHHAYKHPKNTAEVTSMLRKTVSRTLMNSCVSVTQIVKKNRKFSTAIGDLNIRFFHSSTVNHRVL
jgi:hypothetical protein